MPKLYGRPEPPYELRRRVGDISQVAGVERCTLREGPADGVDAAEFRTGSGFAFQVLLGRGMDIARAEYCGVPLAWRSHVPPVHASHFEPEELGWLWGFTGGLMTTCGPTYVGAPCEDEGESLGLHGRASYLPASHVHTDAEWRDGEYAIWAEGRMREARVFGPNVEIRRRISTCLGAHYLIVEDKVENRGFEPVPHQWLYHINIGWPVVDDGSELVVTATACQPRDVSAAEGLENAHRCEPPQPGFQEQVFFHQTVADESGHSCAAILNPAFRGGQGIGVYVRYEREHLPYFVQWKMMGEGTYVMGMEPANCLVMGRSTDRAEGRLQFLQPGEVRRYRLEIGVLPDLDAIQAFRKSVEQTVRKAAKA